MFRDLKEYQEIAKIYADKVSKPENLDERRGSSVEQLKQNRADAIPNKPANWNVITIPITITSAGSAVASIETASPWITFVPWPVVDAFATLWTGL